MPTALEVFRTPSYSNEQGCRTDINMAIWLYAIFMPENNTQYRGLAVSK